MRENHQADASLRRLILDYIAQQGGEVRSDSGQGLRRQICDALAERPTRVSQALIALERRGLLEREMDLERHRCQAIRLVPATVPGGRPSDQRSVDLTAEGARRHAELEAAERELSDLIARAAAVARRVGELRWTALQAESSGSDLATQAMRR